MDELITYLRSVADILEPLPDGDLSDWFRNQADKVEELQAGITRLASPKRFTEDPVVTINDAVKIYAMEAKARMEYAAQFVSKPEGE